VIAQAKCDGLIVITEETPAPLAKFKKIPDVCKSIGIRYTDILGLIRAERWTF
jgi:hypothetical protein